MNALTRAIVSAISWYSIHSPLLPGKSQLQSLGLRLINSPSIIARSRSGWTFVLHFPEDKGWEFLYFGRTYETATIELIRRVLRRDDVVFDVGANIGWYTVNMASAVPHGTCHAFEPMPPTMERLRANCELNGIGANVRFNQVALGYEQGEVTLHSFDSLGHGHNSLSTRGRTDFTSWAVPMTTLDCYITESGIDRVDLVKMDVEGAEMGVMQGASQLFALDLPPAWIIELNDETSREFGYTPPDILEFVASRGEYSFFRIIRGWDAVVPMRDTSDYHHGDNAVCVPHARLDHWRQRLAVK